MEITPSIQSIENTVRELSRKFNELIESFDAQRRTLTPEAFQEAFAAANRDTFTSIKDLINIVSVERQMVDNLQSETGEEVKDSQEIINISSDTNSIIKESVQIQREIAEKIEELNRSGDENNIELVDKLKDLERELKDIDTHLPSNGGEEEKSSGALATMAGVLGSMGDKGKMLASSILGRFGFAGAAEAVGGLSMGGIAKGAGALMKNAPMIGGLIEGGMNLYNTGDVGQSAAVGLGSWGGFAGGAALGGMVGGPFSPVTALGGGLLGAALGSNTLRYSYNTARDFLTGGGEQQSGKGSAPSTENNKFFNSIIKAEGTDKHGDPYNTSLGYMKSPKPLTEMTMGESLAWGQQVRASQGVNSSAKGAFQIVNSTQIAAMKGLGIGMDEKFSPENQKRMAAWIVQNQGLGAWEGFKSHPDQKRVAQEAMMTGEHKNVSGSSSQQSAEPVSNTPTGTPPLSMAGPPSLTSGFASPQSVREATPVPENMQGQNLSPGQQKNLGSAPASPASLTTGFAASNVLDVGKTAGEEKTDGMTKGGLPSGDLVGLGKALQGRGMVISEHPSFGGVHPVHVKNSAHYSGNAIDINAPGGIVEANNPVWGKKFDQLAEQLRAAGYKVIWRQPGHENHLHAQIGGGQGAMYQGPAGGAGAGESQRAPGGMGQEAPSGMSGGGMGQGMPSGGGMPMSPMMPGMGMNPLGMIGSMIGGMLPGGLGGILSPVLGILGSMIGGGMMGGGMGMPMMPMMGGMGMGGMMPAMAGEGPMPEQAPQAEAISQQPYIEPSGPKMVKSEPVAETIPSTPKLEPPAPMPSLPSFASGLQADQQSSTFGGMGMSGGAGDFGFMNPPNFNNSDGSGSAMAGSMGLSSIPGWLDHFDRLTNAVNGPNARHNKLLRR